MTRDIAHPRPIGPLLAAGRLVVVDSHPICASCGAAVRRAGGACWRHVPADAGRPPRSTWLSAPRLGELERFPTYGSFASRFPWAVRPDLGAPVVTTEAEWREAVRRLRAYRAGLHAARRRQALRSGENPYLDLVLVLSSGRDELTAIRAGIVQLLDLASRRRELASHFSWAIPNERALDVLGRYAPLIEIAAGTGYWTALLKSREVDVAAFDLAPPEAGAVNPYHRQQMPWTAVDAGSAVAVARRSGDRTLFLCWPPYDDDAASYAALRAYPGNVLAYVGQHGGGPAGSIRFHRELGLNWTRIESVELPRWPGLNDGLHIYLRNPSRRPLRQRDRCDECRRFIPTGAIGRCDTCFERRPPALAVRVGEHRVEYSGRALVAMPAALRHALEQSPSRIR